MGESVTEGTISRWLKAVGDPVAEGESLVEVTTDKVDVEVPSPTAGTLESITAQEGETVSVGATLATIASGTNGTATPKAAAIIVATVNCDQAPVARGKRGRILFIGVGLTYVYKK